MHKFSQIWNIPFATFPQKPTAFPRGGRGSELRSACKKKKNAKRRRSAAKRPFSAACQTSGGRFGRRFTPAGNERRGASLVFRTDYREMLENRAPGRARPVSSSPERLFCGSPRPSGLPPGLREKPCSPSGPPRRSAPPDKPPHAPKSYAGSKTAPFRM